MKKHVKFPSFGIGALAVGLAAVSTGAVVNHEAPAPRTVTVSAEKSDKHVTAIHFRGPSWQSDLDGSLVEGKAKANSPVPGSIPQLLVEAARNQGTGIFGQVTFVRLTTSGGTAPAGACAEGTVTGVPYRAVYRFFAPVA